MLKLLKHLQKREFGLIAIGICIVLVHVWFDLRLPDYMADITRMVESVGHSANEVFATGLFMLLCALGSVATDVFLCFIVSQISTKFAMNLRKKLYTKVMSLSMEEIGKYSSASLITRNTNDVTQIQNVFYIGLTAVLKSPIMATLAVIKIYNKNFSWTITTVVAVFVLLFMLISIFSFAIPRFKNIQKTTDNINKLTREHLKGIKVVRANNAEKYQESKFDAANCNLYNSSLKVQYAMSIIHPGMDLIMSSLALAIFLVGAFLISSAPAVNRLDLFSDMIVFSGYSAQVMMAFMMFAMTFVVLPRGEVSAKRINEVLDINCKIKDGNGTTNNINLNSNSEVQLKGVLEFKNVSFKYPDADEYILHNINFQVNKGETVAFVGSTGSGKSTVIDLIPRFYDVTDGEITIDGLNIKDYKLHDLRNKLAYVSQNAVIFKGTVRSNIEFGNYSQENNREKRKILEKALEISQADEFVSKMEHNYDSNISQSGSNISGGQKQRLSIARAIYRQPEFYIFDDSFSALDYKTAKKLQQALRNKIQGELGSTTLIVAQRISTILHADKIIVLNNGKVVGIGKHHDLLNNCSIYREIAESQLSEEELKNA